MPCRVCLERIDFQRIKMSKRVFDIFFSIAVISVLSWFGLLISVVIFITTGENPLYFQERIGKDGKPFKIYKFRSMKGKSPLNDPLLSKEESHRITKLGKFIRKYRIDELPQFLNVLKGEMSIVGPRPERQFFLDRMISIIPQYKELQKLRPGITSLGQIKYGYADSLDQMLKRARYDLIYLDNLSVWTDVKVILATIVVVVKGQGR